MSKFVLIDHSLKQIGGHHYEYAIHILTAAHEAGYEPVLAVYRHIARRLGGAAEKSYRQQAALARSEVWPDDFTTVEPCIQPGQDRIDRGLAKRESLPEAPLVT